MSRPPAIEADGWERVDEWSEVAFDAPFVTVEAHNAVYERAAFRKRVAPLIPAHIDESPRATFTTGLSFEPPPPGNETPEAILGIAARYASREFRKSLSQDGLLDVEQTGAKDLRLPGRRTAKAFQYDADYPLEADPLGTSATPRLAVRVWAAIWPTTDAFEMAGGIYPLEDLSGTIERVGGDCPDITIEARPGGDRREMFDRIREAAE